MTETEEREEIKRFDVKTEQKVLKALDKIFVTQNEFTEEETITKEKVGANDKDVVMVCMAKTEEAKRAMSRFISHEEMPNIDKLDYSVDVMLPASVRVSNEYLKYALDILISCSKKNDSTLITAKNTYPITLENEHFRIIVAPRVEE